MGPSGCVVSLLWRRRQGAVARTGSPPLARAGSSWPRASGRVGLSCFGWRNRQAPSARARRGVQPAAVGGAGGQCCVRASWGRDSKAHHLGGFGQATSASQLWVQRLQTRCGRASSSSKAVPAPNRIPPSSASISPGLLPRAPRALCSLLIRTPVPQLGPLLQADLTYWSPWRRLTLTLSL